MKPKTLGSSLASLAAMVLIGLVAPPADARETHPYVEGEVIVKFKAGTRGAGRMGFFATRADARAHVAKTMAGVGRPGVGLVRFPKEMSVEAMAARFQAMPEVLYAVPNYIARIPGLSTSQPSEAPRRGVRAKNGGATRDPNQMVQPWMALQLDRAKAQVFGNPNDPDNAVQDSWYWMGADIIWVDKKAEPMIAVLDTGVDYKHPDLAGRVVKGFDWINADGDPMDDNGHGTHVAGAAAANLNNKKGISGISKAKILAIKVLDVNGFGSYFDIAQGLLQAAGNAQVKIISMSLGGGANSPTLQDAVQASVDAGKLVVAAAGNYDPIFPPPDPTAPVYPAYYADASFPTLSPSVIAVAAGGVLDYQSADPDDFFLNYSCRALYSVYGSWITVTAPGSLVYSTTPRGEFSLNAHFGVPKNYAYLSGTSMATPQVSGTAARAFSAMPAGTTAAQVRQRLIDTGFPEVANGIGTFIDTDGDGATDTECWPTGTNTAATDTFVPGAMQRAEVRGTAFDANGALPLIGARVAAYQGPLRGFGIVDLSATDPAFGNYRVLNLPLNDTTPYDFRVQKAGYTMGYQSFAGGLLDAAGGSYRTIENVGVPRNNGRYHIVTDWDVNARELDSYLYLPDNAPIPFCSIGYYGSCGSGSLTTAPFARWLHDGGYFSGSGPTEQISARPPLYSTATSTNPYQVFVTDYFDGSDMLGGFGVVRFWYAGQIRATVRAENADIDSNDCTINGTGVTTCDAWYVGDFSNTGVFTPQNVFGVFDLSTNPGGVLPYSREGFSRLGGRRPGGGGNTTPPPTDGPRRNRR